MDRILPYWLILLFSGNICQQYVLFNHFGNILFYTSLLLGIFCVLRYVNLIFDPLIVKRYSFLYWYLGIMFLYELLFGWQFNSEKTLTYILSKTVILLGIVPVIEFNSEFYTKRFFYSVACVTSVLLLFGIFNNNMIVAGRQSLGFGNFNSTGALSAVCFGVIFILSKNELKHKWISIIVGLICLYGVLASGSRSSFGIVIISFLTKFGINKKLVIPAIVAYLLLFILLPEIGFNLSGLDRMNEAVESADFSSTRENEREATLLMIEHSPIIGNGIYSGQSEEAQTISTMGSHNAYLDFLKWYGIPLGGLLIIILIKTGVTLYRNFYDTQNSYDRMLLFIVISVLLAANYEAYIWGVNQMITTMFFIALAILEKEYSLQKEE